MKENKVYNMAITLICVAFVVWSIFASQRINVLVANDFDWSNINLTSIKYIVGLTYSAEDMEWLVKLNKSFR